MNDKIPIFFSFIYSEDDFLNLGHSVLGIQHMSVCSDHVSDSEGNMRFSVPLYDDLPANVTKLSLKFTAVDFVANETTGMKQPEAKLGILLLTPFGK